MILIKRTIAWVIMCPIIALVFIAGLPVLALFTAMYLIDWAYKQTIGRDSGSYYA